MVITMEQIPTLENNIRNSFMLVKKDLNLFKINFNKQSKVITQLYENQKTLLLKIRQLEQKIMEKNQERIMEKKIIMTSSKVAPKMQFTASSASKKIHDPICPFAKNIKPKNKIIFSTKAKALNYGFKPCDCLKRI